MKPNLIVFFLLTFSFVIFAQESNQPLLVKSATVSRSESGQMKKEGRSSSLRFNLTLISKYDISKIILDSIWLNEKPFKIFDKKIVTHEIKKSKNRDSVTYNGNRYSIIEFQKFYTDSIVSFNNKPVRNGKQILVSMSSDDYDFSSFHNTLGNDFNVSLKNIELGTVKYYYNHKHYYLVIEKIKDLGTSVGE